MRRPLDCSTCSFRTCARAADTPDAYEWVRRAANELRCDDRQAGVLVSELCATCNEGSSWSTHICECYTWMYITRLRSAVFMAEAVDRYGPLAIKAIKLYDSLLYQNSSVRTIVRGDRSLTDLHRTYDPTWTTTAFQWTPSGTLGVPTVISVTVANRTVARQVW